ncbi:hypothetical protein [Streptomyces sp. SAI-090]|jgi:hypothetical protein|uniref:hypothetical protein n=1 Tax=Streptomyces sp. SAI-090 TaxID=2940545 RepID=UPI0024741B6C|nr:hypothetical protein [Streptomyces sp. SAI-090]MDH6522309.1 hypothetical protein [Streptomyces sp. SAI-090]
MNTTGIHVRRARRWFWTLTTVAVLAMGGLYRALGQTPSPGTGALVAVSSLILLASLVQAARILTALAGPPRLPRLSRPRPGRRREAGAPRPANPDQGGPAGHRAARPTHRPDRPASSRKGTSPCATTAPSASTPTSPPP